MVIEINESAIKDILTEDGSRKLAVVGWGLDVGGTNRFPRAMLTIPVMWVSGPNTWIGTPNVSPVIWVYSRYHQIGNCSFVNQL